MKRTQTEIRAAVEAVARRLNPVARETVIKENLWKHSWEVGFLLDAGFAEPSVCDLGGGVGVNLLVLRELGIRSRLMLIDRFDEYSEGNRMGAWAEIQHLVEDAGIEVHAQDFWANPSLPLEDGSVQVATCLDVIEHLPGHPLRQLRELLRILVADGQCLISGPNAASLSKRIKVVLGKNPYSPFAEWTQDKYYEHYREYTRSEYEELMRRAAFKRVKSVASVAVTSCRARNRFLRRTRSWLSPHPYALYGMAVVETLAPSLRHSIYVSGAKLAH